MASNKIVRWNADRGFGFVRLEDGREAFLHVSDVEPKQPRGVDLRGRKVEVHRVADGPKGLRVASAALAPERVTVTLYLNKEEHLAARLPSGEYEIPCWAIAASPLIPEAEVEIELVKGAIEDLRLTERGRATVGAAAEEVAAATLSFRQSHYDPGTGWGFNARHYPGGFHLTLADERGAHVPFKGVGRWANAGAHRFYGPQETGAESCRLVYVRSGPEMANVPDSVKGIPENLQDHEEFTGTARFVPQVDGRYPWPISLVSFQVTGRKKFIRLDLEGEVIELPNLAECEVETTAGELARAAAVAGLEVLTGLRGEPHPRALPPEEVIRATLLNIGGTQLRVTIAGWLHANLRLCPLCRQEMQWWGPDGKCYTCTFGRER